MTTMQDGPSFRDPGGTTTKDEEAAALANHSSESQSPIVLVGRLVSLRFVWGALRRRRKIWLSLATLGLVVGISYHLAVPRSYNAYATLYLAQAPGTDPAAGIANDLALLQTNVVGQRAANLLGEPSLSPLKLLGKAPGTVQSDNVLILNVAGPTKAEAVRRANALAKALLGVRSDLIQEQTASADKALQVEMSSLQQEVGQLSVTINGLGASSQSSQLTTLVGKQSSDTNEIASLEQTVQQNQLASVAVTSGSRVVTAGTLVPASTKKLFVLDGISGLIGGLIIGLTFVALQAVVSDRLRRRDELASILGTPVELSLVPIRHPRFRNDKWVKRSALEPSGEVSLFGGYLRRREVRRGRPEDAARCRRGRPDRPGRGSGRACEVPGRRGRGGPGRGPHEGRPLRPGGEESQVEGESFPDRSGSRIQLITPSPRTTSTKLVSHLGLQRPR